jgi:hypothetical protein
MIEEIFEYALKFFVITQCLLPLVIIVLLVVASYVIHLFSK